MTCIDGYRAPVSDAWTMLQRRKRASGGTPVVTFVDLARDERTELSAVSLENAAAKIANALREEFDTEPGTVIGLHLPPHWQRSAWCAGAWTAGCIVAPGSTDADLIVASSDLAAGLVGGRQDVAVVSLHPFGLPLTDALPDGAFDVTIPVRQQPDAYLFDSPQPGYAALTIGDSRLTQAEAFERAAERARDWGLARGGTLLVPEALDVIDSWLAVLAVPLAVDASVVLLAGGAPSAALRDRERATATAEVRR